MPPRIIALAPARADEVQPRFSDFVELTKPRLSLMSVASAVLGYFAAGPEVEAPLFLSLLGGTALAAFGAAALNQAWERDADARMARTEERPVAAGRVSPRVAYAYGVALSLLGVGLLALGVNWVASALTAATVVLYVLAYTPLKKLSPWATEVGAVPGALPPLIGWVAAGAGFSSLGWVLFAVLFAWQIPHFMAISWMCRDDYKRGGFAMLSVADTTGRRTARKAFLWTLLLVALSFAPAACVALGGLFWVLTAALGLYHLVPAWRYLRDPASPAAARRLFFATIIYLPLYLATLVVARLV